MKNVCVVIDGYFALYKNRVISPNLGYSFWRRYLQVFKTLTILTRRPKNIFTKGKVVSGDKIFFLFCPYFSDLSGFLVSGFANILFFLKIKGTHSLIFRVPGLIPFLFGYLCVLTNKRFALEVVADPYDVFSKHSFQHILRPLFRLFFTFSLRFLCQYASAISYVTKYSLQKRYPPNFKAFTCSYSSIELKTSYIKKEPHQFFLNSHPILVNVGMMQKRIKGQDIFLEIIYNLKLNNFYTEGILIGDGDSISVFKDMAKYLNINSQVTFVGLVPNGKRIMRYLDKATFYISPSRQEGLPRAIIEAMARGLPCLASNVGGTSELLDDFCLCKLDAQEFASKIKFLWANKRKMARLSDRNKKVAADYVESTLKKRRNAFYTFIKNRL